MADSDNEMKVNVKVAVAGEDGIQALNVSLTETAAKTSEADEKSKLLEKTMEELDKISPGLGQGINLLAQAYIKAGTAAEGGKVSLGGFTQALGGVTRSLGPLTIAMLTIEAAMTWWDFYKDKVEAAAKAQEEATKRIVESTREAQKAVQKLDDAMHPGKQDTAGKDEEQLKNRLEAMEDMAGRRRDLNKANEEKELQSASSPEEKRKIQDKYEVLDKQLEDWRAKQKAAIESATVAEMESQLKKLKEEADKLVKKTHAEFQYGLLTGDMTRYNKTTEELAGKASEARAIRDRLDPLSSQQHHDATRAAFDSETNRQVYSTKGMAYLAPHTGDHAPGPGFEQRKQIEDMLPKVFAADSSHYEGGKAFDRTQLQTITALQALLEKSHQNSQQILAMIVDGVKKHESLEQIIAQVKAQMDNSRNYRQTG